MASRRSLIEDAIVTALNEIQTASGWAIDLIAQHSLEEANPLAGDVANTRHRAFVLTSSEVFDLQAMHSHSRTTLEVAIDYFPAPTTVSAGVRDAIDAGVTAIAKRMLEELNEDPPFGVAGVEDARIRWEPFALERDNVVGATVTLTVFYRHNITDPATYG